ncbi:MAG: type II CAAX prenyl endopeptidase Rce1 family protein [Pyrobaculum sp.]
MNYIVLLALTALMAASPLFGRLAAVFTIFLFRKQVTWVRLDPKFLLAAFLTYAATFAIDYLTVGPPTHVPTWWDAVILTPLAEEFVFRALAFSLLPPPLSWLFAVVVFGALHNLPHLATLYGLALSLAYRGGGLVASVALHSINNALWLALATGRL